MESCQNYQLLNDESRSNVVSTQGILKSDDRLDNRWYRFNGGNNSQIIQTTCIKAYSKCGTLSPGWMNGRHPKGNKIGPILF